MGVFESKGRWVSVWRRKFVGFAMEFVVYVSKTGDGRKRKTSKANGKMKTFTVQHQPVSRTFLAERKGNVTKGAKVGLKFEHLVRGGIKVTNFLREK